MAARNTSRSASNNKPRTPAFSEERFDDNAFAEMILDREQLVEAGPCAAASVFRRSISSPGRDGADSSCAAGATDGDKLGRVRTRLEADSIRTCLEGLRPLVGDISITISVQSAERQYNNTDGRRSMTRRTRVSFTLTHADRLVVRSLTLHLT